MSEQTTLMGYDVQRAPGDRRQPYDLAYILTGVRGAQYGLLRSERPERMFAVRPNGTTCALKGNAWFTDKDGYLTAIN